jgi:hypothetical protein
MMRGWLLAQPRAGAGIRRRQLVSTPACSSGPGSRESCKCLGVTRRGLTLAIVSCPQEASVATSMNRGNLVFRKPAIIVVVFIFISSLATDAMASRFRPAKRSRPGSGRAASTARPEPVAPGHRAGRSRAHSLRRSAARAFAGAAASVVVLAGAANAGASQSVQTAGVVDAKTAGGLAVGLLAAKLIQRRSDPEVQRNKRIRKERRRLYKNVY